MTTIGRTTKRCTTLIQKPWFSGFRRYLRTAGQHGGKALGARRAGTTAKRTKRGRLAFL